MGKSMWSNFGKGITPQDLAMARTMNAYWVNFARTGDPNGPGLPRWPAITRGGNQLMNFTMQGAKAETDPWKARLDLVEPKP
ncbi:MAG TPA: carboxylesterase family protein [Terriglobia bacterium]|nr:carboxylesterase family protein [Terriglobia bacterium]